MASTRDFKIVAALLALAFAIGGAGVSFPMLEMLLGLCSVAVIAYLLLTRRTWPLNRQTRGAVLFLGLVLLLPLCQLIPLPPSVWSALPGRSAPSELDAMLGWQVWRPVSLDAEGTLRAFLTLLPAAAVFLGAISLSRTERTQLLWLIVAFALLNAMLGIIQVVTGGSFTPFASAHVGYPIGLFVNRNHNAALLLAAMPIVGSLAATQLLRGKSRLAVVMVAIAIITIFAVVVLGTTSRMGLLVLPFAVAMALLLMFRRQSPWRVALPAVLVMFVLALVLSVGGGFGGTLSRFSSLEDGRLDFWSNTIWAIGHYGLVGTGFGTFAPIFQTGESLETLTPAWVNHAHNDYLELLLEGGIPAVALMMSFLVLFGSALFAAAKSRKGEVALVSVGAAAAVLLLLLCSLVDYPLRMTAHSALFAALCAILLPTRSSDPKRAGRELTIPATGKRRLTLQRGGALVLLAIVSVLIVQAGISAFALTEKNIREAARWAPWSTRAHERAATAALFVDDFKVARAEAQSALKLSPISTASIRTLGLADLADGHTHRGNRLMQIATVLGWRDPFTQLWAIDTAKNAGEPEKALQRAEALFIQRKYVAGALAALLRTPDERIRSLLVGRLAAEPAWRPTLFRASRKLPPRQLDQFVLVTEALAASKAPLNVVEVEPLVTALIDAGNLNAAQKVWAQARRGELIANGSFQATDAEGGGLIPKFWQVSGGVLADTPPSGDGREAARIMTNEPGTPLAQRLLLTPGTYRLRYRALVEGGTGATLNWRLSCAGAGGTQTGDSRVGPAGAWSRYTLDFTVPDQDCAIQRLALAHARASLPNSGTAVWLDDVELRAVSR